MTASEPATGAAAPRALVVDDSQFMRTVIGDILSEGGVEVVAEAKHGEEAVAAVAEHDPDVVTMDVEMPVMDGIEAVERIMAEHPTPVLMLSAHTEEDAAVTFEALDAGAVDFVRKPGGEVSMNMPRLEDQLVEMVTSVAGADVGPVAPFEPDAGPDTEDVGTLSETCATPTLVIGSSTGGPKMVERLLADLPRAAGFRVLIVQHMPAGFTGRFAARIDDRSAYEVREATDGDRVREGEALVAAGDSHMVVTSDLDGELVVSLSQSAPVNSVRPAVDVTMESAANRVDTPLVGVVLTGMGADGAAGLQAVKAAGGRTIAQDAATSAVYGMPKRAVETGCVDHQLAIEDIPAGVLDICGREAT